MQKETQSVEAEKLSASEQMSELVKFMAWPATPGDGLKECFIKAADVLKINSKEAREVKLNYGVLKRLWFKERKIIPTEMSDYIRKRAAEHRNNLKMAAYDRQLNKAMYGAIVAMQECDKAYFSSSIEAVGDCLFLDGNEARQGCEVD